MVVRDLIVELQVLPQNAWIDATFDGRAVYAVTGAEALTLPDGRVFALINIIDGVPLAVA